MACLLVLLIDLEVSPGLGRQASETPLFRKYLLRAYYVWDNELQVQKCHSPPRDKVIWERRWMFKSDIKRSIVTVAVLCHGTRCR